MDRTACTEPQCLYKGALYLLLTYGLDDTRLETRPRQLLQNVQKGSGAHPAS